MSVANVYFELTREFNAHDTVAALSSGQAVVYYRLAIMSKDGDWIVREDPAACDRILSVLAAHGARHRPAPPLETRWLRGGWSSHFEFFDAAGRRIRCDFVSRPPRVAPDALVRMFQQPCDDGLLVVEREMLIRLKQTGRAKDYAIIGELARQLDEDHEIAWTPDVDRLLALSGRTDAASLRPSVRAARSGANRAAVVAALAQELDDLQQSDRARVRAYQRAAEAYLNEFRRMCLDTMPLREAHGEAVHLAEALLPEHPADTI